MLTPGYGAVIQFIPIYLSATIQEATAYQLASDLFCLIGGFPPK